MIGVAGLRSRFALLRLSLGVLGRESASIAWNVIDFATLVFHCVGSKCEALARILLEIEHNYPRNPFYNAQRKRQIGNAGVCFVVGMGACARYNHDKTNNRSIRFGCRLKVIPLGLEPRTPTLKVLCSTCWATRSPVPMIRTYPFWWCKCSQYFLFCKKYLDFFVKNQLYGSNCVSGILVKSPNHGRWFFSGSHPRGVCMVKTAIFHGIYWRNKNFP